MYTRFAVYFTPEGDFADHGAAWLGWDLRGGVEVAHPVVATLDVAALTQRPRKYGFHGTIKAPFQLARGRAFEDLDSRFRALCARLAPTTVNAVQVTALGRFLALAPQGDQSGLRALAAQVVRDLDDFRAPLSAEDMARRRRSNLSAAQEALLLRWGYPHVMDAFRFHMTLTGPIPRGQVPQVQQAVAGHFAPVLPRPFTLDRLSLVGERADGRFEEIARQTLGETT